ncbi:MAG: DUF2993 domain-containing protein [Armatimonadetes bacterium]|nr:DUF2993 domain-containing protein [Armatimonadota bacterium]
MAQRGESSLPRTLLITLVTLNVIMAGVACFIRAGWPIAEAGARRKIERALGSGRYEVNISLTTWWDLLAGRVVWLEVRGADVRLRNGLPATSLSLSMYDLEAHGNQLVKLDDAAWSAVVSESDINDYLRTRQKRGVRPAVTLADGSMTVSARGPLGIGLPVAVTGSMRVSGEAALDFEVDQAQIVSVEVSRPLEALLLVLNPVVDLQSLPFGLHIREFRLMRGEIRIRGTASPQLPLLLKSPTPTVTPEQTSR